MECAGADDDVVTDLLQDTPNTSRVRGDGEPSVSPLRAEPGPREVLLLAGFTYVVAFLVIAMVEPFSDRVAAFGDNTSYVAIARAIGAWDFSELNPYHFWGLSYLIAAVSRLTFLPEWWALTAICLGSALGAVYLIQRLWGGWVACYFIVLSLEWQQRALLGGAEPLFVLLVVASFAAVRRDRWLFAALFAALSTVVRPVGVFALLAIGIVLLVRRSYGKLMASTTVGALVGAAYMLPLVTYFGDPLANFRFYQNQDWGSASPIGFPFVAVINGAIAFDLPWTSRIRAALWVMFYVLAVVVMLRRPWFRDYARRYPVEVLFAVGYILFAFSYNSPIWAWVEFPRYALPALPMALYAVSEYLPRDRRVVWSLAAVSAALAAASAMNVRRVVDVLRTRF